MRLSRPLLASPSNTALFAYGAGTLYGGTRSPDNGMFNTSGSLRLSSLLLLGDHFAFPYGNVMQLPHLWQVRKALVLTPDAK